MDREREGGMCLIAAVIWAVLVVMCYVMCGCSGKKVVTESVLVHDTLIVMHRDTISIERWGLRHDTIRLETEKVVTLLQPDRETKAETIRVEMNHFQFEREIVRDSSAKVVSRVDSILKSLDRQKEKAVTRNRPPIKEYLIFLVVVGIGIVLILIRNK